MKSFVKTLLPLLLMAACTGTPKDDGTSLPPPLYQQPRSFPANPKGGYSVNLVTGDSIQPIINTLGDTLLTGVPIPAQGKRIHPDSVARPKVIKTPPLSSLKKYNTHRNRFKVQENMPTFPVDASKLTKILVPQVAKDDTTHYILNRFGQKVPTGVRIPATGKKVPIKHPQPTQALPMAMKDGAIANIQYLDAEQGMASSLVRGIAEDKNGNLWFGTDAGLNKYDGQSFTLFTPKEGFVIGRVFSIAEDKSGNLWFGTFGGGVSKYEPPKDGQVGSFTHFTENEGLSKNEVTSIAEDKNGHIWFGTDGGGVNKYDGQSFTHFTKKEGLSNNTVWEIAADKAGNLWFSTFGGGVSKYNGQSFAHYTENEGLSNNTVFTIAEDKNGNLWFGTTGGGVSKYNARLPARAGSDGNDGVGQGQSQPAGQASFTHFTEKEGLNNNNIRSSLADKNGNLWFGTGGSGVCKYEPSKDGQVGSFTHFTVKEGLSSNNVESIAEDKNGNLWFGTVGGGVSKYDGKAFTHFTEKEGLSNSSVPSILEDKNGHLWFGTMGGGVSKYDGKAFTHFTEKEGLSNNRVASILEDKNGHLWFGTMGGGVSKYDGKAFTHFTEKEGLSYNSVPSIAEDKNGHLWFGTYGGGVNKYDGKYLTHFSKKEGLGHNSVRKVLVDKNGHLWLATWDGVNKLEKDAYQPSPYPLVVHLRLLYINEALPNYRNPLDSSIEAIQFDSVQAFENFPINPRIPSNQNHLSFQFSAIDWSAPTKIKYSFRLLGLDNKWSNPSAITLADYRNLQHGKFIFQVRAIGESGEWSKSFDYPFTILPPWWKTWWAYTIYVLLFLVALRAFSLWRERRLRKEKEQLQNKVEERTIELKQKSEQLEHSLTDLKSTQSQLIQSEKLASLGELTAGIAHEIQNPLNFVNNFSELSGELIDEMNEEIENGNLEEVKAISGDLKQNLEKINTHGKRASSIVKGMLEHSRASTGVKELTDINALAEEYLRLAYHGLRAKDKDFNSDFKTDFDPNLPKIAMISQDIGRVLLNLINNAFWAVKTVDNPLVIVKTEQSDNQIIIKVIDNGTGMSQEVKAKIFQPFFTTKPTGHGTGLGLSLAYDIVTKGQGGTLEVESTEGSGSEFTIKLSL